MLRPTFIPLLLLLPLLTCCVEEEGEDAFEYVLVTLPHPVGASSKILTSGRWLVYLADESDYAGGTDMNGDGDVIDAIAVRVDVYTNQRTELNTDVEDMALVNGTLFLVVLESLNNDWNGDSDFDDWVLLYQTPADSSPTFLAETADGSSATVLVGLQNQAFFTSDVESSAPGETNLFATSVLTSGSIPTVPVSVLFKDPLIPETTPIQILDEAEDVLFLAMNEDSEIDLNDDGDPDDSKVLALLDCSSLDPKIVSTELALGSTHSLTATTYGSDRIVAFLVNEAAQDKNLNDSDDFGGNWPPENCLSTMDADKDDDVLHWLHMADFEAGGVIHNTGLVGTAGDYLYAHPQGYVACVSMEVDEGSGGCDMNDDGDTDDRIFRWIAAKDPASLVVKPARLKNELMAMVTTVPGSFGDCTCGVLALSNLWVLLVDEAADGRDHDGDGLEDKELIGARGLSLDETAPWNFNHGSSNAGPVGVSWMAADIQTPNRSLMAFQESVLGSDLNGDGDLVDSVPTFPVVHTGSTLKFFGIGVAVSSDNAGIVTAAGVGYFRISEKEEGNTDINADGTDDGFILSRVVLNDSASLAHMGTLNNLDRPAVQFDSKSAPKFGVMLVDESMQGPSGTDINNDGDKSDYLLRYFRIDN